MVPAHHWKDRIGDFCVADYLPKLNMVHLVGYQFPLTRGWRVTARCRDEIALKRAPQRKAVAGCRVAEFWPHPRNAEKAHSGVSLFYGA
jgi:hypothetical protein